MKFDNLNDLPVLLAIADTGGLTAAGRRCDLSTAAVSAALKRLEKSLGVRLFERTTRLVRPTAEGEVMIEHARQAMALLAQGQAQVRTGTLGLAGNIRIAVGTLLAQEMMAHWLAEFAAAYPGLTLDLLVGDERSDLIREGIDLALRAGPLPDSSHTARLLVSAHRMACASPQYLQRRGVPASPQALTEHDCLVHQSRGRLLDEWMFLPAHNSGGTPLPVKVRGPLTCHNAFIAYEWALQGRGIIYVSELALGRSLASGALVRLFPDYLGALTPLYAVLPGGRFEPARVRALMNGLAAAFEQWRVGGAAGALGGYKYPIENASMAMHT
ncbi:MAG: LysR family transcriptional regulator [Polaromonas sp.]|nr:MAG: LysR family transcriptional regulator [Polaromonas sp.]